MKTHTLHPGKILYGLVFMLIIPIGLWIWANYTESVIRFPAIESKAAGWLLALTGSLLMSWGMWALIKLGKGLPMNAYPPERLVSRGPYRLSRHPIYWGFGFLLAGFFILTGSSSGLWLVTPVTILCMIALIWGYEKIDLQKRFPGQTISTLFDLPAHRSEPADLRDRFVSWFWITLILLAGILLNTAYAWGVLAFIVTGLIFSALWAQIIEGSEKLKRPFGYYGALVGIVFESLVVWAMGFHVWLIIGVLSVIMPWAQAIGRLRCLVNGCCHGEKVNNPKIGIRYFHYRSRVCGISHLKGELLHPTQLYSILWLLFLGFLLLVLWNEQFPVPFIFGLYLIFTGIGRFVEEAYRGEVQTPIIGGLRLYQWTAILSVIIGMFMTTIQIEPAVIVPDFSWEIFLAALIGGLFTTFVMGIDFPYSNARFSRLV